MRKSTLVTVPISQLSTSISSLTISRSASFLSCSPPFYHSLSTFTICSSTVWLRQAHCLFCNASLCHNSILAFCSSSLFHQPTGELLWALPSPAYSRLYPYVANIAWTPSESHLPKALSVSPVRQTVAANSRLFLQVSLGSSQSAFLPASSYLTPGIR